MADKPTSLQFRIWEETHRPLFEDPTSAGYQKETKKLMALKVEYIKLRKRMKEIETQVEKIENTEPRWGNEYRSPKREYGLPKVK